VVPLDKAELARKEVLHKSFKKHVAQANETLTEVYVTHMAHSALNSQPFLHFTQQKPFCSFSHQFALLPSLVAFLRI
jgi:hypothetical protein